MIHSFSWEPLPGFYVVEDFRSLHEPFVDTHLLLRMLHRPIFRRVHLPLPNSATLGKPT